MEKVIYKWIDNLIKGGEIPFDIIDENFNIEDGMTLNQYWDYERANFAKYADGCRLKDGFSVDIINTQKLSEDKKIVVIYVKNNTGKVVFKMNITILNNDKISSNDFHSHMVPKFVIENKQITKLGIAIKSNLELENIVSTDLEIINFGKSSSFEEDGFYSAQFIADEEMQNRYFTFHLKFAENKKTEKRKIFFDNFDFSNCPYTLGDWTVATKDEAYPVNLAVYYVDGRVKNIPYPQREIEAFIGVKQIIVTDSLDNDWIISTR
jgi:hypothetical protein